MKNMPKGWTRRRMMRCQAWLDNAQSALNGVSVRNDYPFAQLLLNKTRLRNAKRHIASAIYALRHAAKALEVIR